MGQFLQQLINGIQIGSIYALIALGYTMVYGIVRLINFAHADIFMVGGYMGFFLAPVMAKIFGGAFIPTIIAAMLIAAVLIGINIVMTVSLGMVNGFTSQFFIGHAGFMAVGVYYTSAMITTVWLLKDSLEGELGHLSTMEDELENEMEAYAEDHEETREALHNLLSMKGIGVVSAMSLLYLFRTYPGANRNEITARAGLDPGGRQSGSSLNGGRKISRAGDPMLRKVLYLACMNCIQHNQCIQAFYKHFVSDNHNEPTLHCSLA